VLERELYEALAPAEDHPVLAVLGEEALLLAADHDAEGLPLGEHLFERRAGDHHCRGRATLRGLFC